MAHSRPDMAGTALESDGKVLAARCQSSMSRGRGLCVLSPHSLTQNRNPAGWNFPQNKGREAGRVSHPLDLGTQLP